MDGINKEMVRTMKEIFDELITLESESYFESEMIDHIKDWLNENVPECIEPTVLPEAGMLTGIRVGPKNGEKRAVVFSAHLDTKGTEKKENRNIEFFEDGQYWKFSDGEKAVGVDDRSGIAVILHMLSEINNRSDGYEWINDLTEGFDLMVFFTVREEVGQIGSITMPISWLTEHNIRHVISIDRDSYGPIVDPQKSCAKGRHYVKEYKGIELLSDNDELHDLLDQKNFPEHPKGVISSNCADTLEIKGRWLAEYVLPEISPENSMIDDYEKETEKVLQELIDHNPDPEDRDRPAKIGMGDAPRSTRYSIMKDIQNQIRSQDLDTKYLLSAVNLSMETKNNCFKLSELEKTENILRNMLKRYSEKL